MARNIYNLSTTFDIPMEGIVTIAADTKEEAVAICNKMFGRGKKNLEIVDIYDTKDAPGIEDIMPVDEDGNLITLN